MSIKKSYKPKVGMKQKIIKLGKEGITCALVFHQRLYSSKNIFYHKASDHSFQIPVDYPNVLARDFKGQVENSNINIQHQSHMDVFMLVIKQRLESPKIVCNKLQGLIIVHVIKINLTDFDGYHKVTYKYVPHLGKLDKSMH